jgi:hypothetical protein
MSAAFPLALAGFLAAALPASAQDALRADLAADSSLPTTLGVGPQNREPDYEFGLTAGVHGRFSLPFGAADRDITGYAGGGGAVIVVDQNISWNQLFRAGWGAEAEIDIMVGSTRQRGHEFRYGAYIVLEEDHYDGDSVTDDFGGKMKVDDLSMNTFIVGGKVVQPFGDQFFTSGRLGVGAVHYSQVEATFSGPLVAPFTGEFIRDTWTFAFEVKGYAGLKLGPVNLVAGMGLRILLPPSEGDAVSLSSGLFYTFDLEVGAEIGF